MFDKDLNFTGKHAFYLKDLCELRANVPDRDKHAKFKILNSYIDAYILCPLIGYQYNRKATADNSIPDDVGILLDAITRRKKELKFVYQVLMLADEESEPDPDKRIYRATNFSENTDEEKEFMKNNMKIYDSYFYGGIEVLHEQFVDQCITDDDYLKQMYKFVKDFEEEQNGEALSESINRYLNK